MEQIIKAYGKFLLDGIVMVALLVIIFTGITDDAGNHGALAIIGANLEIRNVNYKAYNDFSSTYKNECNKAAPTIVYAGSHLQKGVNKLSDHIKAADYAGNELVIDVISILDESGAELIGEYNSDTSEIDFWSAGVYTVKISAVDVNNKSTMCTILVPVSN